MFGKNKKYNILVLGNNGMLGYELYENLLKMSSEKTSKIGTVIGIDVKDGIDLTKRHALEDYFMTSIHFDYCINCVAHTDTKAAETTTEGKTLDYKLNALAPKYIAESCKHHKTKLIHISTDYVFSEKSKDIKPSIHTPSMPQFGTYDDPFPTNTYGMNKLFGEKFIEEEFGHDSKEYCICRVSWIYGMHNNKSFIHKFLKNVVKSIKEGKTECEMTSNEFSVPTSCNYVVESIVQVIENNFNGIKHCIPGSINGVSRLQFAQEILTCLKGIKVNDVELSEFNLIGVERDSYWPKWSVMRSSYLIGIFGWSVDLMEFMTHNAIQLVEWAKKENCINER